MASTCSLIVAQILPPHLTPHKAHVRNHAPAALPSRRQSLLLLTATAALTAMEMPSRAQDIPLFGLRKSLRRAEEEAELIVKEGFDAADKVIVAAEKGVAAAEKEIETEVRFGGLEQAGAVAGVEVVGVLIATSVVNGILRPEPSKS